MALRLFQFVDLGVDDSDELLNLSTRCMHTVLLGQVSNVQHNALLIVKNHFIALKAEHPFPLV